MLHLQYGCATLIDGLGQVVSQPVSRTRMRVVSCPDPTPKRERGSGIIITSEFLVVLSQHVRKTGNPIRLLDLQQSCDMKEK